MKKLWFLFLAVLLFSCTRSEAQNDYYGTWVHGTEDGHKMEYAVTSTIFTSTYTPRTPTLIAPIKRETYEIFSWEKITNEDAGSKRDYPTGFLIGLKGGLGYTTLSLFIHRNKNNLISAYEYEGSYRKDVYVKQGNNTRAVTGQQELFRFISELTDNFPASAEQAVNQFIAHDFIPDKDSANFHGKDNTFIHVEASTYVHVYDKVKAVVYYAKGSDSSLLSILKGSIDNDTIHFILEFDNETACATTFQNMTSYLSKKYDEEKWQFYSDEVNGTYSYLYSGPSVKIFIMDGRGLYDGFTILITIGP